MECTTRSESETIALGAALGRLLRGGDVVALDGQLGAGKTRLVRGMTRGLAIDPAHVASPTYVIVHAYQAGEPGRERGLGILHHVDAYRLHGDDELDSVGWDRVIDRDNRRACEGTAAVIEWARKLPAALGELAPEHLARIELRIVEGHPDRRTILLDLPAGWLAPAAPDRRRDAAAFVEVASGFTHSLPDGWSRCPTTHRPVAPWSPTFPFIDEKARMADLGKWFSGAYTVSRELQAEDLEDPDIRPARE